jgi:hypothetical protein
VAEQFAPWRRFLVVAGMLVFLAGVPLTLFSHSTDRLFAWTIDPPVTAGFLGAAYWSSVMLQLGAARAPRWADARVSLPGVFVFTALTLVATLIHVDRFHFTSSSSTARVAAWVWIAIYVSVPVIMLRLARHRYGRDDTVTMRLPTWLLVGLVVHAATLAVVGGALFVAPQTGTTLWPWPLTPLTARAVGAWLMGIAVVAGHSVWANDRSKTKVAMLGYAAFGSFQLITIVRFAHEIHWSRPSAWVYLAFVVSAVVLGITGVFAARKSRGGGSGDSPMSREGPANRLTFVATHRPTR